MINTTTGITKSISLYIKIPLKIYYCLAVGILSNPPTINITLFIFPG